MLFLKIQATIPICGNCRPQTHRICTTDALGKIWHQGKEKATALICDGAISTASSTTQTVNPINMIKSCGECRFALALLLMAHALGAVAIAKKANFGQPSGRCLLAEKKSALLIVSADKSLY